MKMTSSSCWMVTRNFHVGFSRFTAASVAELVLNPLLGRLRSFYHEPEKLTGPTLGIHRGTL